MKLILVIYFALTSQLAKFQESSGHMWPVVTVLGCKGGEQEPQYYGRSLELCEETGS